MKYQKKSYVKIDHLFLVFSLVIIMSVLLSVISDIHREFSNINLSPGNADIVAVVGDLERPDSDLSLPDALHGGVKWLSQEIHDRPVLFIPGNHDYLNNKVSDALAAMRRAAEGTNVHVLWNETYDFKGIRFIGTPLWTNPVRPGDNLDQIKKAITERVGLQLSFRDDGEKLDFDWLLEQHLQAKDFIAQELAKEKDIPKVVLTHWAPSLRSQPNDFYFKGSDLEGYWSSDCEELVQQATLWAHGHFHSSVDYRIGKNKKRGRVISNPRGKVKFANMSENPKFTKGFLVKI